MRADRLGGPATLDDLILPPRCAGCGAPGEWLCGECRGDCEPERIAPAGALRGRAVGAFAGPLREAVHALKYDGQHALAGDLGDLLGRLVSEDLAVGLRLDALVPVPLHPSRLRERGYDQAALIAGRAAAASGLPVIPAIRRIRATRPQVDLDRAARAANAAGAFVGIAGSLGGLRVGLVDDVTTTGATLGAAAAAARAAGARAVRAYVVASDL